MRSLVGFLLVAVMTLTLASIALARGAPNEKVFTDQAIVSVHVTPIVADIPLMTGFDVIQENTAVTRVGNAQSITDTSDMREQGTTGDERGFMATGYCLSRSGPQPDLVLLA